MNQDQQAQPTPTATELAGVIPVESLDQFVHHLTAWHTQRVEQVKHLLEIPEGAIFEIGEGTEATQLTLTGDVKAAFKLGVEMVLMQLGELPFIAEMEDNEPTADAAG